MSTTAKQLTKAVLKIRQDFGSCTVTDLADFFGMPRSSTYRMILRAVEQDVLTYTPHKAGSIRVV